MAYIDNEQINLIRNNSNIVEIIGEYVSLTAKGRNYFGVCPFHDDHSPSMSVSQEKQIYTCFSCGATGNVFTFIQNYEHISFIEAVIKVGNKVGINLGINLKNKELKKDKVEYQILDYTQKYYVNNLTTNMGEKALNYLHNRGINDDIINKFGIGLSLNDGTSLSKILFNKGYDHNAISQLGLIISEDKPIDTFQNRIMFPIANQHGQIVGYSGRIYNNEDASKYVNSKSSAIFKKSEILYNYSLAKEEVRKDKYLIVVEGFMDVIRLSTININNCVATMGTALTKEHIDMIKQLRVPVYICFDNDDAGINANINNGEQLLYANIQTKVITLDKAKDPDEYILKNGAEAFSKKIENATPYLDYRFNYLKLMTDANNTTEVAKTVNSMLKILDHIDDSVLKELMIKKISSEYSLDKELIASKISSKDTKKPIEFKIKNIDKKNKYQKACEILIYLIVSDLKYLKQFEKKLGYFPYPEYSKLLNEIRYFYEKNHEVNIADFMSHIYDKEDLQNIMREIITLVGDNNYENDIDEFLNIVEEKIYQNRVDGLKIDLNKTTDYDEKLRIINKIAKLKKDKEKNNRKE